MELEPKKCEGACFCTGECRARKDTSEWEKFKKEAMEKIKEYYETRANPLRANRKD